MPVMILRSAVSCPRHATKSATTTRVQNADDEELAALEWREVLPDKVTRAGAPGPVSLREWLKTSLVPFYVKE